MSCLNHILQRSTILLRTKKMVKCCVSYCFYGWICNKSYSNSFCVQLKEAHPQITAHFYKKKTNIILSYKSKTIGSIETIFPLHKWFSHFPVFRFSLNCRTILSLYVWSWKPIWSLFLWFTNEKSFWTFQKSV